jgi:hypothetical protein
MGTYNFSQNSFTLPRWLSEMGCFRWTNWDLHVGGHGVLPLATGKKFKNINKTSLILTDNLTCTLSLSPEISVYADLGAPKRQHRTSSPECAKTC